MKVFIGGSKELKTLDVSVLVKLESLVKQGVDFLIGDCFGVDLLVQQFLHKRGYKNVTIYASNGIVRNNVGNWKVIAVRVPECIERFEFYRTKDRTMQ